MGRLFDYTVFPLLLPFILLWLAAARVLSMAVPVLLYPLHLVLNRRLREALPFLPHLWRHEGWLLGGLLRLGFEASHTMNVARRFLTLPLRRRTPDFLVVGFPQSGSCSMSAYLKLHPCISGIDGLNYNEALSHESRFFCGALGRRWGASARAAYRSFFPTCLTRWWVEAVKRSGKWLVFDACPATACLDFSAARLARLTPDAKLVFMMRDPVAGAFSSEIMLRNLGMPLNYSLMEDARPADPRFAATPDDVSYWQQVSALGPEDPLPADLMQRFYTSPYALLRSGRYADRIAPFLQHFKRENILFIDHTTFCTHPEATVKQVLEFVGADSSLLSYRTLPPSMQSERKGRRMHPSVKRKLAGYFAEPNERLYALLGRDFGWGDQESGSGFPWTRLPSSYMGLPSRLALTQQQGPKAQQTQQQSLEHQQQQQQQQQGPQKQGSGSSGGSVSMMASAVAGDTIAAVIPVADAV